MVEQAWDKAIDIPVPRWENRSKKESSIIKVLKFSQANVGFFMRPGDNSCGSWLGSGLWAVSSVIIVPFKNKTGARELGDHLGILSTAHSYLTKNFLLQININIINRFFISIEIIIQFSSFN